MHAWEIEPPVFHFVLGGVVLDVLLRIKWLSGNSLRVDLGSITPV